MPARTREQRAAATVNHGDAGSPSAASLQHRHRWRCLPYLRELPIIAAVNREERRKAIDNAILLATGNPLVPAAVRVGVAALGEEVRELRARVEKLEQERPETRTGAA
jgi:hypothetical protein